MMRNDNFACRINVAAGKFWTLVLFFGSVAAGSQAPDTRWYTANPEASRFTISTAVELAGFARIVNGNWGGTPERDNFSGKTVVLAANITLSPQGNWVPIGNYAGDTNSVFSGIFDGGGHTISNLTIDRPTRDYQGLFGRVSNGRVENVGLDRVNVKGRDFVGGVAGVVHRGSVAGCYSTGTVTGAGEYTGGVVGAAFERGSVIGSYFAGTISGESYTGGVAGVVFDNSSVVNSYSTGVVSGKWSVGGVAGLIFQKSSVVNSYSTAVVGGNNNVGGLAGAVYEECVLIGSAALNLDVKGVGKQVGRVAGNTSNAMLSNNVANSKMKNSVGNTKWTSKGSVSEDGVDIPASAIKSDKTLGGRFTESGGWTTESGKLPGLHGRAVAIPVHLR